VLVYSLPQVSLGSDISFIAGNTVTLDAGQGFSTYLWSTGASSQTIVVNQAGSFSVTVTNQYGCSASDMIILTVLFPDPVVIVSDDATICLNGSVSLSVSASGAVPPYHYLWSTGLLTRILQ